MLTCWVLIGSHEMFVLSSFVAPWALGSLHSCHTAGAQELFVLGVSSYGSGICKAVHSHWGLAVLPPSLVSPGKQVSEHSLQHPPTTLSHALLFPLPGPKQSSRSSRESPLSSNPILSNSAYIPNLLCYSQGLDFRNQSYFPFVFDTLSHPSFEAVSP